MTLQLISIFINSIIGTRVKDLFHFFMAEPACLPNSWYELLRANERDDTFKARVIADYIAGMTDQFLLRQYHEHLGYAPGPPSPVAHLP